MVEIFWDISPLEGEDSTLPRNVGIGLLFDTATYSRRTKSKFYFVIVSFVEICLSVVFFAINHAEKRPNCMTIFFRLGNLT